jgi:hypothetical protein
MDHLDLDRVRAYVLAEEADLARGYVVPFRVERGPVYVTALKKCDVSLISQPNVRPVTPVPARRERVRENVRCGRDRMQSNGAILAASVGEHRSQGSGMLHGKLRFQPGPNRGWESA